MRADFLSLLLMLCTLPASQAIPTDWRELSVSLTVATASKSTPHSVLKKGGEAGVKARVDSDTEDCEGESPEELCASLGDDCTTCVGATELHCAFDVKGHKCVPETTTGLTLATDKKTCGTLLAAEQVKVLRHPVSGRRSASCQSTQNPQVKAVAEAAFSSTVQAHVFEGSATKPNSGRHILSVWTRAYPTSKENKWDKTTGVVEFQRRALKIFQNGPGGKFKTVWNDLDADGTFVYKKAQIIELCLRGYELSILNNPSNAATLKALEQPAASSSGKGKGKPKPKPTVPPASLKIMSGLDNGFVVYNSLIKQNELGSRQAPKVRRARATPTSKIEIMTQWIAVLDILLSVIFFPCNNAKAAP
ncbi:hypothetical protein B0H11DRAFT_2199110 [Mycena galericulata]|nr:hypothetical protein B0H11DRAFT_2199110 [Mycena galericulata]